MLKSSCKTVPVQHLDPCAPLIVPEHVRPSDEQSTVTNKRPAPGVGPGPTPQATLLQVRPHRHLRGKKVTILDKRGRREISSKETSVAEPKLFIFGSGSDFEHNFGSGFGSSSQLQPYIGT